MRHKFHENNCGLYFKKRFWQRADSMDKRRRTSELLISGLKSDTHRAGPYVGALKPVLHPWLENFEGK